MYRIGDIVVHPCHGAGVIDSIKEEKIDGCTRMYYAIKITDVELDLKFTTEGAKRIGVRPIIDSKQADELMAEISQIDAKMAGSWNNRHRENLQRIKSGELIEVARVIKGLMTRGVEKGLSTIDRDTLKKAKQIFISEIVLSKKLTSEEVESQLTQIFISGIVESKKLNYDDVESRINASLA